MTSELIAVANRSQPFPRGWVNFRLRLRPLRTQFATRPATLLAKEEGSSLCLSA